ncbi:MAG: hypothetical protein K8E24_014365 [Methanobacterium paludis]|nr:hypothetical protein [Methanobacterium paludis]
MGFWNHLTHLLNTDAVERASEEKWTKEEIERRRHRQTHNDDSKDFESSNLRDRIPFKVNRTIPNFRYAFKYDHTVNSTINNLIIVANNEYEIVGETDEYKDAVDHIKEKCKEWDIGQFADTFIKRNMVDGSSFINRYVENGTIKLKYLANDGVDFNWLIIRDPDTEEVLQYKQSVRKTKLPTNWKTADYYEIQQEEDWDTIKFDPAEIIYSNYMEENGKGVSALYSILDLVDVKGKLELYMLLAGHKAGAFLGLKIGNENIDASSVDSGFINDVMKWFSESNGKDVIAYPDGIDPTTIGNQVLPDYPAYISFITTEIRNAILTPDSKFSSTSSNRATATEQLNTSTGYQGFIIYLQDFVCKCINQEVIDKELELFDSKAVGKVKFQYINEEMIDEVVLSDTGTKLKNMYPDLNSELMIRTYFPRFARQMDKYKAYYGDKWEEKLDKDMGKMEDPTGATGGSNLWSKPGMNSYNETMHNQTVAQKQNNLKKQTQQTHIIKPTGGG